MALSSIINGVIPTIVRGVVDVATELRLDQRDEVTDAVGRTYNDYEEEFATLRVFDLNSNEFVDLQSFDFVPQRAPNTVLDYLLIQSLSEVHVERMSPTYTFGSPVVYTSGSDSKMFVYNAAIISDKVTGDSLARFNRSYTNALRATKLVNPEQPRYVELQYRDQVRRGYVTSLSTQLSSSTPNLATVTFTIFVVSTSSKAK